MAQETNNLYLIEILDLTIGGEPPSGDKQWRKPKYGLSLQPSDYHFYPVISFYKNKGIKRIYIEETHIDNWKTKILTELGTSILTHHQIFDIMTESLRVHSLGTFYNMIHTIMNMWIKCITGKDVTIPKTPLIEYFGIEIINKDDERKISSEQEELEENIRKQFPLSVFSFEEEFSCSIL